MPALQRGKSSEKGRESVPIPIGDCLVDGVAMVTGLGVPLLRRQLQQALRPHDNCPLRPRRPWVLRGPPGGQGKMQACHLGLWGGLCRQTATGGWEGLATCPANLQEVDPGYLPPLSPSLDPPQACTGPCTSTGGWSNTSHYLCSLTTKGHLVSTYCVLGTWCFPVLSFHPQKTLREGLNIVSPRAQRGNLPRPVG